jgi:hypothetical protein
MKKVILVMAIIAGALVVNAHPKTYMATSNVTTVSMQQDERTPVKPEDLMKPIKDNIAKDYAGYTIKEATSVKSMDTLTYEVVVAKGTATLTLVYDKDGKFLKKMEPKM